VHPGAAMQPTGAGLWMLGHGSSMHGCWVGRWAARWATRFRAGAMWCWNEAPSVLGAQVWRCASHSSAVGVTRSSGSEHAAVAADECVWACGLASGMHPGAAWGGVVGLHRSDVHGLISGWASQAHMYQKNMKQEKRKTAAATNRHNQAGGGCGGSGGLRGGRRAAGRRGRLHSCRARN